MSNSAHLITTTTTTTRSTMHTVQSIKARMTEADRKKLTTEDEKAIAALLDERKQIPEGSYGRLSGNTKRINAVLGKATATEANINGFQITFTKSSSSAPKAPATQAAVAKLKAERKTVPNWNPGRTAAITREIQRMEKELAAKS